MEGDGDQCQIQLGKWSQGESNGNDVNKKTLQGVGLFPSRIRALRLEPRGRVIPHPMKINNEYQGLQEGNLNGKTFTKKINYGLTNCIDSFARDPQGRTKHGTK